MKVEGRGEKDMVMDSYYIVVRKALREVDGNLAREIANIEQQRGTGGVKW